MTLSPFDTLVGQMTAMNIPREKAIARARELYPELAPDPAEERRRADIREKDEQKEVTRIFVRHGFKVRSTSQSRASKVAIGLPDLFVTHKTLPIGFWFETKRQVGGVVSDAQREFGEDCRRCNIPWYSGDRFTALELMRQLNLQEIP